MSKAETWKELTSVLKNMNEEELRNAINFEVSTFKRKSMIIRMHQRYSLLMGKRVREQLLKGETLL